MTEETCGACESFPVYSRKEAGICLNQGSGRYIVGRDSPACPSFSPTSPIAEINQALVEMYKEYLASGKPWYESRAMVGSLVSLGALGATAVASVLGYTLRVDVQALTDVVFPLIGLLATLVSVYGTLHRTRPIKRVTKEVSEDDEDVWVPAPAGSSGEHFPGGRGVR